jgi:four helix bundle protein
MFLQLKHQQLDVFQTAKQYVQECYKFTKHLPADERFNMIQQIRRAALSVVLNIVKVLSANQKRSGKDILKFSVVR